MYFDTHCHFDHLQERLPTTWEACQQAGIRRLLLPAVEIAQWPAVAEYCEKNAGIYGAFGLHPWWVKADTDLVALKAALEESYPSPNIIAVGECGLDGSSDTPMELQEAVLAVHLQFACNLNLPLTLHAHRAHNELIRQLKKFAPPAGGVIHAFSGSLEIAEAYIKLGFKLGIGGTITYERAKKTRSTIQQIPLSTLVLETDAPDIPLAGHQGEPNSPLYVPEIARCLAEIRGESVDVVEETSWENACEVFGLPASIE